jgi:hypothetical protein
MKHELLAAGTSALDEGTSVLRLLEQTAANNEQRGQRVARGALQLDMGRMMANFAEAGLNKKGRSTPPLPSTTDDTSQETRKWCL